MQREAKNCRKQHFQYGQVPFSSRDNTFIYSVPKVKSKSKIPVLKRKPRSTTKNHFIYGRSEDSETSSSGLQQERNLIKQKTTIIRNKASLKIDAREEYEKFQERKKKLAADTKQEKKKDFELLKTYNPPWNGNGTGNENTKTKVKELALDGFELQCFGKPGCGAPLRTESGIVKTTKSVDPETRFQKRDRSQIFGLEEPRNYQRVKDPPKSSINILGQPNIYGFLMKKDVSRSSHDILGAPRVKERKGKKGRETKTKEITSEPVEKIIQHVKIKRKGLNDGIQIHDKQKAFVPLDCVETAVSTNKDKCDTNPGTRNTSVFRMYDPWGRSGGGGPKYDKEGNVVAQKMNIVKDEILPSFKTESQKEMNFLGQTVGNDRKDNVKNGNYYRAPTYTKGIVSLDKRRSILPGETIEEFKERQENLNGGKVDNIKTELNKNINHETKQKIQNNLKPPHSSDTPDRVKTKHDKARNMANEDPKDYSQNEGINSNAVPELPDIHGYVPSAQEINTNKSMVDKIMEPENSVVKARENSVADNNEHREDFSKSAVSNEIKKEIQLNQRTDINKVKVSQKTKESPVLSNAIKRKLGKVKQPR